MLIKSRTICYELTDELVLRAYFEDDSTNTYEIENAASDKSTAESLIKLLAANCALPSQISDICMDFR